MDERELWEFTVASDGLEPLAKRGDRLIADPNLRPKKGDVCILQIGPFPFAPEREPTNRVVRLSHRAGPWQIVDDLDGGGSLNVSSRDKHRRLWPVISVTRVFYPPLATSRAAP